MDNLSVIEYDGHTWRVGYFGDERRWGFSAYGFMQDDTHYIRVTSKYEAEVMARGLIALGGFISLAKAKV